MREYFITYTPMREYPVVVFAGSYLRLADYFARVENELRHRRYKGKVLLDQFACNGSSGRFASVWFNGSSLDVENIQRVSCSNMVVSYCNDVLAGMPDVLSNAVARLERW